MTKAPTFNELLSTNKYSTYIEAVEAHAALVGGPEVAPNLGSMSDQTEASTIHPEVAEKAVRDFGARAIAAAARITGKA